MKLSDIHPAKVLNDVVKFIANLVDFIETFVFNPKSFDFLIREPIVLHRK